MQNPFAQTVAILLVVFSIQVFSGLNHDFFVLNVPLEAYTFTIVTSVYSHASLSHLASNILGLVVFSLPIARLTSKLRFHLFFILVGSLAGISQVLSIYYLVELGLLDFEEVPGVLGSSGAVFGFFGYLLSSNKVTGFFANIISMPDYVSYLFYLSIGVFVTLATASPGVALIAHFTGFVIGVLAGRKNLLKS